MKTSHLITRTIATCFALTLATISASSHATTPEAVAAKFEHREDVIAFINEMHQQHKFSKDELLQLFAKARPRKAIVKAISNPAESKKWFQYRPIFIKETRIEAGQVFWNEHKKLLTQAEEEFGVPIEIITAIIGVETKYGSHTGKFKVLDSLATLAFNYPKRSKFFRKELEHFLLLTREEDISPYTAKGSYAGAMGRPQFISSSYRNYAIDFDKDGKRDLWKSDADVIGSVANYFSRHGWRNGEPVAVKATILAKTIDPKFLAAVAKPTIKYKDMKAAGIVGFTDLPADMPVNLLELDNSDGKEYWLTTHNFYVITRYNHSELYAMAAFQLANLIRNRMQ